MKNRILNKLRKTMATMMMACMLLTVVSVSSDADLGTMICGGEIQTETNES